MAKGKSAGRRIVIDASVARSAGDRVPADSVAMACKNALEAFLDSGHILILSDKIMSEWNKHKSRFSSKWLKQMFSKKRIIIMVDDDDDRRRQLDCLVSVINSEKDKWAAEKDYHLIVAALNSDKVVLSRDDNARRIYAGCCHLIIGLREIVWSNPHDDEEELCDWLRSGAEHQHKFGIDRRISSLQKRATGAASSKLG